MSEQEAYTLQKLDRVRRMIASRMTEAMATIPHFRMSEDIEVDKLLAAGAAWGENSEWRISVNDLLVKACATALMAVPEVNVQWADDGIRRFRQADVSVVMALPQGLSTPIVCGADRLTVHEISVEIRRLAERATANQLRLEELVGGSFSISNLGMHGVQSFDAIINPPQCAMLAVGEARPRLVVGLDRQPRIVTSVRVTLSVDHRAIDGATAAAFLAALRQQIEHPSQLMPEAAP